MPERTFFVEILQFVGFNRVPLSADLESFRMVGPTGIGDKFHCTPTFIMSKGYLDGDFSKEIAVS